MLQDTDKVHVRYMVGDVAAAVHFYTTHLGFTLLSNYAPAFADVRRGHLRLLLSGPTSSAGRPMPDGRQPRPGGWNRAARDRITPLPANPSPLLLPRVAAHPKALLHTVAFPETIQRQLTVAPRAEPARQVGSTIIVKRTSRNSAAHGTCALCWTGPGPLAGIVRRDTANAAEARAICSRCLVTLEMLAAQFDSQLRLQIETPA
jgi:catechol 2,3-dioxygenase-like lactoylglutathione lyase family enzyme